MAGITTSIRLSPEMRSRLDHASKILQKGKNSIINEAIEVYLKDLEHEDMVSEAKRQSLLVQEVTDEDELWENNADIVEGDSSEKR